jgi:cyclohexa-1,5-dienecarbonyl-CoA hydratase
MANRSFETIQVEREGAGCTIVLNQPPLNIIDFAMIQEIRRTLRDLESEKDIRTIVFRGAGPKGFSAGVSVQDHAPDRVAEVIPAFDDIFRLLAKTEKLTLAVVHGFCFGGGFELAMMCDLVVASDDAKFAQPEIKLGQVAPIGLIMLPPLIGYRNAAELLFSGKTVTGNEALALGLVNRVTPPAELRKATDDLLREINAHSGATIGLTKRALLQLWGADFEKRLRETEEFFLHQVAKSADAKEGIQAFMEKRAPQWTHA